MRKHIFFTLLTLMTYTEIYAQAPRTSYGSAGRVRDNNYINELLRLDSILCANGFSLPITGTVNAVVAGLTGGDTAINSSYLPLINTQLTTVVQNTNKLEGGEQHIGYISKGTPGRATVTPGLTAGVAYAAGQILGGVMTFANILRTDGGYAHLSHIVITARSPMTATGTLYIFSEIISAAVYADKNAFNLTPADAAKICAVIRVPATTNYIGNPTGGINNYVADVAAIFPAATATVNNNLIIYSSEMGNGVYGVFVLDNAPTPLSSSDITFKMIVENY